MLEPVPEVPLEPNLLVTVIGIFCSGVVSRPMIRNICWNSIVAIYLLNYPPGGQHTMIPAT